MQLKKQFEDRFKNTPILITSPGRINLIGEHTDYNDGFVLPAAIDRYIHMAMAPNGTEGHCRLYAADLDTAFAAELSQIQPLKEPGWANYVLGVAAELIDEGAVLKGFDCMFTGNIPIGGGLSSSAALENATAVGLNHLFQLERNKKVLMHLSQRAEHNYAKVKCGIMDQFASMMGRAEQAMLLDCRSLDYDYVPLHLGDYQIVLCDTNVSHSLADSEYNIRRQECEEAVRLLQPAFPEIEALRDLTPVGLKAERARLSDVLFRRALHVVEENERVHLATGALRGGNLEQLGDLLYQSHHSLQYDYEVSCPELDFLVDQTRDRSDVLGARMMGGGFGGCTINLVKKEKVEDFLRDLSKAYRLDMGQEMKHYIVKAVDGAKLSAED